MMDFSTASVLRVVRYVFGQFCIWLTLASPVAAAPDIPVVKHLGISFGRWDPVSGQAGEFVFSSKYNYDTTQKTFMSFGDRIINDLTGPMGKANNSMAYYVPAGVPVRSMIDGIVQRIEQNTGATTDKEIHISPGISYGPWLLIVDHVANVLVSVGQRISAGDMIAETSGLPVEFGINRQFLPLRAGAPVADFCPMAFLEPKLKDGLLQSVRDLQTDWETYKNNKSLYDESAMAMPGCVTLDLSSDNANAERLFEWAEATLPSVISPSGTRSQTAQGYYYRYYSTTGNYLGMKDGRIYYSDGKSLTDLGVLTSFLGQAFAAGY